jgi:hypothetical protein
VKEHSLDRRLGGPQGGSGRNGRKKYLGPAGNRTPAIQPVGHLYIDSYPVSDVEDDNDDDDDAYDDDNNNNNFVSLLRYL